MLALVFAIAFLGCARAQSDAQLQQIAEQIWAADANRVADSDVVYNVAGPKLFTYVNEAVFQGETFAAFLNVLDNYNPAIGQAENCDTSCQIEQEIFLDVIMVTQPMQLAWNFLKQHGLASSTESGFRGELRQYWFQLYSRSSGPLDSSGFEHCFHGEYRSNEVTGFHNWVSFYLEEKAGNLEYIRHLDTCDPENVKFNFYWHNYEKPISSAWMKTSIEVEIALFTICFQARQTSSCPITIDGGTRVDITTYSMSGVSPRTIGTAYPRC